MKHLLAFLFAFTFAASAQRSQLVCTNIAELLAKTPSTFNTSVEVLGYYHPNRGGGGKYVITNSVTGTNAYGGMFASTLSGWSWLLQHDGSVYAEQFGAIANDGLDDLAAINGAISWIKDQYGGTVKLGAGVFHTAGSINLKFRVHLKGASQANFTDGFSATSSDAFYFLGTRTWIRLLSGANVPAVVMDASDGWIRQPSKTLEDGEVVDGRQQDSTISDLTIYTRPSEHTKYNVDGIYAMSKWGLGVHNVVIFGFPGYAIRLLDCNAVSLKDIYIKGNSGIGGTRGLFAWSCADNEWSNISVGGVAGPGIWLSETWKTQGVNTFVWNSVRTNSAYQSASVLSDGFILDATTVALESGDPVMLRNYNWVSDGAWYTNAPMGVLPTGFTSTNLYFAVKFSSTRFGVHTNRALAIEGTALPLSGYSGTNWLTTGYGSGMYVSNSRQNNFAGIRSDQNSDHGFVIHASNNNVFTSVTTQNNGGAYNGETDQQEAGIFFGNGADRNTFQQASIHDCYFGGYADAGSSNNYFDSQYKGISGGALAQRFDATLNSNFRPVYQTFNGLVSSQSIGTIAAGTVGITNTLTVGTSANGLSLDIYGNAAGVAVVRMTRPGVVTNEIGVTTGAIQFKNVGEDTTFMDFRTGTTRDLTLGNVSAVASTKTGRILGEDATGTDVAGGNVQIRTGQSTGNATPSSLSLYTTTIGSTGSSSQTEVESAKFFYGGSGQDTRLLLYNEDTGTLRRVGSTNLDVGDGVTRSYLYLK